MYIDFNDVEGIELPEKQKLLLEKGVLLLERQNKDLLFNDEKGQVTIQIYFSEDEMMVYSETFLLPIHPFNFAKQIEDSLFMDNEEERTPEMETFITSIYKELKQKREKKHPKWGQPKQAVLAKKGVKKASELEPEKKQQGVKKSSFSVSKKRRVAVAVFFLCLVFGIGVFTVIPNLFITHTPSYEDLLKEGNYKEAAKQYPKKKELIEQRLYEQAVKTKNTEEIEKLATFQDEFPSNFGSFDLAILHYDYKQAVDIYEKDPDVFEKSNDRQILAGYSYLKLEKRELANEIAKSIDSVELERYIATYDQYSDQINHLEKKLEELKKDPIKNRTDIEKTMNLLFDIKEKLKNL